MCASSAGLTRGCDSGAPNSGSHNAIQKNPIAPVATNAQYHPKLIVIHGTINGAATAPILVPELKRPVANARSFSGNHSATVLIAAGKLPASPMPSANRAAMNPATDGAYTRPNTPSTVATAGPYVAASAWAIAATLHRPTAIAKP